MKSISANANLRQRIYIPFVVTSLCLFLATLALEQAAAAEVPRSTVSSFGGAQPFDTPQMAADALVNAAEAFDVAALTQIFGPDGNDIVFSGEIPQDRKHAAEFAAQARKKKSVSVDPRTGTRAFLIVGDDEWPFP